VVTFSVTSAKRATVSSGKKKTIRILRDRRKILHDSFDMMLEGCQIIDHNWRYFYLNDAAARHGGMRKEKMLGKTMMEMYPGIEDTTMFHTLQSCKEKRTCARMTNEFEFPDGKKGFFELSIVPVPEGILILSIDVTEAKKAENAIKRAEEKYRSLCQNIPGMVYRARSNWSTEIISNSRNVCGYTIEDFDSGRVNWLNLIHPDDRERVMKEAAPIRERAGSILQEYKIVNREKEVRWVEDHKSSFFSEDGILEGVDGVVFDTTERKKAEQRLRESEQKYRDLIDSAPDGILVLNLEGVIESANPAFLRLIGYHSEEEIVGKHFTKLKTVRKEDIPRFIEMFRSIIEQKQSSPVEFLYVRRDGTSRWAEIHPGLLTEDGELVGIQIIMIDVSARKDLEEKLQDHSEHLEELVKKRTEQLEAAQTQLLKVERLAAIGQLAGMVGHDLRNPLTGIAGATYYIKTNSRKKLNQRSSGMLDVIEENVQRSNKIINDLLEYSREIKLEISETSPKSLLERALRLVEIPQNVELKNLTRDRPKIKVDVERMTRVFVNLIRNAVDALSRGGTLTVRGYRSGDTTRFSFTDTGEGMTKCMLDKIWNPLFTTKAKGMGFGLAISKRIVEAHRGRISVQTAIALGSKFTIIIPTNLGMTRSELMELSKSARQTSFRSECKTIVHEEIETHSN
jgi:two-component system cell cycle sensor histidine kinase/response regulator CckA